jgi:peroxiredoxin
MKVLSLALLIFVLSFSAIAQQNLKIGDPAPEFSAAAIDGTKLTLSQMRGKVVLLTFWATYCPICQAELPKLNAVAESFKGKDIVFIGVTAEKAAVVKSYLKENPRNFAVVPDGFGLMMQYGDKSKDGKMDMGYPNYYLIDQQGKIAMRGSGFDKTAAIDKEIGSLLGAVKQDVKKP